MQSSGIKEKIIKRKSFDDGFTVRVKKNKKDKERTRRRKFEREEKFIIDEHILDEEE